MLAAEPANTLASTAVIILLEVSASNGLDLRASVSCVASVLLREICWLICWTKELAKFFFKISLPGSSGALELKKLWQL